jgi:hypothetical protein
MKHKMELKKRRNNRSVSYIITLILLVITIGLFSNKYVTYTGVALFILYALHRLSKRGYELGKGEKGSVREAIKKYVKKRQIGVCGWKGCDETLYLKLHHIIPRNMGGDNAVSNLVYVCPKHHDMAHDTGDGTPSYGAVPEYLQGVK